MLNFLLSLILAIALLFAYQPMAIAQNAPVSGEQAAYEIVNTAINDLPPMPEDGYVPDYGDVEGVEYIMSREWSAGDAPADVLKVGDIESGLGAEELTLGQIEEITGADFDEITIGNLEFLEGVSMDEFLKDVPFLEEWTAKEIPALEKYSQYGEIFSGDRTLGDIIAANPEIGEMEVRDVIGDVSISEIPNLDKAQLNDFEGVGDKTISQVPGLGDVPLGSFPIPVAMPSLNFFPKQDIAFGGKEYSGLSGTPQSVSGGTDGTQIWRSMACIGGCAHIELTDSGWEGAQWMTKDHRVRDGFGVLGSMHGEAGAYRIPFGPAFALQVTSTDEKTGIAEWGIAFRFCKRGIIDLGCTAYFMEVPLGIETAEGEDIITGVRDGLGGATIPLDAPAGWEEKRPKLPPRLQRLANASKSRYGGRRACGAASVKGEFVDRASEAMEELGWGGSQDDASLMIGTAIENGVDDPAHLAYILATAGHESDGFRTMEEYGKGKGKAYGDDYGRGYIQVTWRENREKLDKVLGINSADNPDLLTDPEVAAQAAAIGMRDGMYTGMSLDDFGRGESFDWVGARRIINGTDRDVMIAGYGQRIYQKVKGADTKSLEGLGDSGCGSASGGVASISTSASLEEILYEYEPASFQQFDAYRQYRNSYHGGLDLDYRIGLGEGGEVSSLTAGEVIEIRQISTGETTGIPSISVRIRTYDENGNEIEQRYTHLSETSVREAIGVGVGEGAGMQISAGQYIGQVGEDDHVSGGAHLDYKVLINGNFSDPTQFMETLYNGDNGGTIDTLDIHSGGRGRITIGNVGGREDDKKVQKKP